MNGKHDYYETLGINRGANKEEIRKAYRKLARQYHPDVNKAPDAESRFKEINEAYEILSDDNKRARYDRFGHAGVGNGTGDFSGFGGFGGFDDILNDLFSGFGTGFSSNASAARRAPRRGADLRYDLTISFEEAVFGCDKDIEVSRHETCSQCNGTGAEPGTTPVRCAQCNGTGEVRRVQQSFLGAFVNVSTCPACQGEGEVISTPCHVCKGKKQVRKARTIKVKIPPGVDNGTQIRLAGEGESGTNNGPQGNLYVVLNVKEHAYFHRDGNDIVLEVIINVAQAALGDEITIPTLHGEEKLVIPAGTQSGEVFTLRAKGVPYLRRSGRGDQKVMVRVATPTELTEHQRSLLRELGNTLGKEIVPQIGKGFFDKVKDAFGV
jgi:molecular chaperone DnaJ